MSMAPYEYYNDFSYMEPTMDSAVAGVGGFLLVFVLLFYLLMIGYAVLTYVLHSAGLYTIAKRRGIRNPWLSWIPLGDMWILGSLSDQFQYVAKGKVRNRRKVLMGLTIGLFAVMFLMIAGAIAMGIGAAVSDAMAGSALAVILLCYLAMMVVAVILAVFQYIAYYDLFSSCNPDNAVLYLVLSIFLNVVLPFFVFFSRKKDLGMPPRKDARQTAQTASAALPCEETVTVICDEEVQEPVEAEPVEVPAVEATVEAVQPQASEETEE